MISVLFLYNSYVKAFLQFLHIVRFVLDHHTVLLWRRRRVPCLLAGGRGRGREDEDLISGSSNTNRTIIAIGGGAIERRKAHTWLIEREKGKGI